MLENWTGRKLKKPFHEANDAILRNISLKKITNKQTKKQKNSSDKHVCLLL